MFLTECAPRCLPGVLKDYAELRRAYVESRLEMVEVGPIASSDGTRKLTKTIRISGVRQFTDLFSCMSQATNEIAMGALCESSSVEELGEVWESLAARAQWYGSRQVDLWFVDDCCHERATLQRHFPSLCQGVTLDDSGLGLSSRHKRFLDLDDNHNVTLVNNNALCEHVCAQLWEAASSEEDMALGFDIEWTATFSGPASKVGTIQLAVSAMQVYVFHITAMGGVHKALKQVLESPTIIKVGRCIAGDVTKLKTDFNVHVKHCQDIGPLAYEKGMSNRGNNSLADLTDLVLDRTLPKPR